MRKSKILVVDDDPEILDMLRLTFEIENYEVIDAVNGKEALDKIKYEEPDVIVLDCMMPEMDGYEVAQKVRESRMSRHTPIIMLTAKGSVKDKIKGMELGIDDYVVKPFEPDELVARIKMILHRTSQNLDANPLTKLPGNVSIIKCIENRINANTLFAVCHIDLRQFKAFNDKYGFDAGDQIIFETARMLSEVVGKFGNENDFVGHVGGDDFVLVTAPDKVDTICNEIISTFDKYILRFYSPEDQEKGYIISRDRLDNIVRFPIMMMCIAVVTNEHRDITCAAEVSQIAAELASYAKSASRSNYVKDQRSP